MPLSSPIEVFDRRVLRLRRERAAQNIGQFDFLLAEVAARLVERLDVIQRTFPLVADFGGGHGLLTRHLRQRKGTDMVVSMDASFGMVHQAGAPSIVADDEFPPFRAASLDAVVSNLSLHWVNDLPGALLQIQHVLKPDGLFLASIIGGESLKELRGCLMEAELLVTGGASPRVSPFADSHDIGALLQRAGFALPVVDSDIVTVDYAHPLKLMHDLRGMGASNAVIRRLKKPTRRRVLLEAARLYQEKFADGRGRVPATFQVIYMIGWAPHESQQQPLKPGSAKNSLAEALRTVERSAEEKAGPADD